MAYPNLKSTIGSKSFYNFDHVNMKWNFKGLNDWFLLVEKFFLLLPIGTALLVLCSTDMSENSYYGDTMLQYVNRNGDSSNIQPSALSIEYFPSL